MRGRVWTVAVVLVPSMVVAVGCGGSNDATTPATTTTISTRPQTQLIDVGGRRTELVCAGKGSPLVFLEPGLGAAADVWEAVMAGLASSSRVCARSRGGTGASDASTQPPTISRAADELYALVRAARLPTPIIVVGHSLGGPIVRAFAARHRAEVAGVVLVEGTPLSLLPALAQQITPDAASNPERFDIDGELDALGTLGLDADGALGDLPLVVVRAGAREKPAAIDAAAWVTIERITNEGIEVQTKLSSRGRLVIATGSGHTVPSEKPQVVVDAVRVVLTEARG